MKKLTIEMLDKMVLEALGTEEAKPKQNAFQKLMEVARRRRGTAEEEAVVEETE